MNFPLGMTMDQPHSTVAILGKAIKAGADKLWIMTLWTPKLNHYDIKNSETTKW
jgi:hypothetical protein